MAGWHNVARLHDMPPARTSFGLPPNLPSAAPQRGPVPTQEVPMNYLVSRHPGALEWLHQQYPGQPCVTLAHLDSGLQLGPGDRVSGVLPIQWVERIGHAQAEAWVLVVQVPESLRGKELGAQQLTDLGAQLVQYKVRALRSKPSPWSGNVVASVPPRPSVRAWRP